MENPFPRCHALILAGWLLLPAVPAGAAGPCDPQRPPPEIAARVNALPKVQPETPRVALVVGNSQYQGLPPTPNAVNDARDMAAVLARLGFQVLCGIDLSRDEFRETLDRYRETLKQSGHQATGLFYYAGHGAQRNDTNYLIPVDGGPRAPASPAGVSGPRGLQRVPVPSADEPAGADGLRLIELDPVLQKITGAGNRQGSHYIILDACRDNPLGQGWAKPKPSFDIRGLFWAFGTGYGKTAADGAGRNGVFTRHLLDMIGAQGDTVEQLLKRVTAAVAQETGGAQTPETGGSLTSDFQFVPGDRVLVHTTYEETPLVLKVFLGGLLAASLALALLYQRHRARTAWTRGIDLSAKLLVSARVLAEVQQKSRLATEDIVGYVKELRAGKLLALVTPKYDLTLGRDDNVNLVLGHKAVSGQHACLGWDPERGGFWIEDLHSTNGTWWGPDERLRPGQRHPLESGQVFYLADETIPLAVIAHKDRIEDA